MPHDARETVESLHHEEACDSERVGYDSPNREASPPQSPVLTPAKTSPATVSMYSQSPIPSVKSPWTSTYESLSRDILEPVPASSLPEPGSSSSILVTVLPTPTSLGHSETAIMPSPTDFMANPLQATHDLEGHKRTLSRPMPIMMVKEPMGDLSFARGTIIVKDSKGIEFPLQCTHVKITADPSSEKTGMTGYCIEGTALMNVDSPAGGLFQYEVPASASTQSSQGISRNMLIMQSPPDPSTGFT